MAHSGDLLPTRLRWILLVRKGALQAVSRLIVLLASVAFLAESHFCLAQGAASPETRAQLDEINQKISSESSEIERIELASTQLNTELQKLKTTIEELRREEKNLSEQLKRIRRQQDELKLQIARTAIEIKQVREKSLKRIRAVYVRGPESMLEQLLVVGQQTGFEERALYLSRIREADQKTLNRMRDLSMLRQRQHTELEVLLQNHDLLKKNLLDQRSSIALKIKSQQAVAESYENERANREAALTQLRAQALRLETVVTSLTGGDNDAARVTAKAPAVETKQSGPFEGKGLKIASLVLPVDGLLLKRVVERGAERAQELVFKKGLEFIANAGSDVRAIADGKVIYVGRMPVYGTIVILDHGKREYSLYGRLSQVKVESEQVLAQSEVVGQVPEPELDAGNFYFEIRKNGQPVNPRGYFKKLPATKSK